MSATIRIELNGKLFLRDPEQTELGRTIVRESIRLIDELGFEHFTFKKLAQHITSTEASVYRYFENKHKLLLYLVSWYWNWLDYRISYHTHHVADAAEKLRTFIRILAGSHGSEPLEANVDVQALGRIVVLEASKAYLTKEVDTDNKAGLFQDYKNLCHKISLVVLEINPVYPFPHALVSTLFEAARKHLFFAQHLPSLTEVRLESTGENTLVGFLNHLAFSSLSKEASTVGASL
ncbi:TetR/AcrR family transcriptional regulator [Rufibacter immobilis]|uniref:TetR/AcrR family transcriptional regulator n=1 Tax=Rufibacter immobilis TaxID=1348778 RepID=A0A3M9MVQ5_9BACT|nr:TetR/AcrR family transcriptional regulator [Rufibacter immobilis]RNI29599.1 TetR/AcrR family transcriptional regulator [Rufibacter immobilis]